MLACTLALAQASSAQAQGVHLFRAPSEIAPADLKWAANAARGLDDEALVSAEGNQLKVRIASRVSKAALLDALNSAGAGYSDANDVRSASGSAMPTRIDTGDPDGDDARYDAAKRAWIEAHPDAYKAICNGAGSQDHSTNNR